MPRSQSSPCRHPLWEFPAPLPDDGERCVLCGVRYQRPAYFDGWSRNEIEDLRAYFMIHALRLMVDDHEISAPAAARERARIARKRGWLTEVDARALESEFLDEDS